MRAAITSKLKEITNFGNRCYQSFTAPTNVAKPYCTFKFSGEYSYPLNKKGSVIDLQVFIYCEPSTFSSLDSLEKSVREKLHNAMLTTSSGRKFTVYYSMTQPDYFDDLSNLFMKRVYFTIPLSRV